MYSNILNTLTHEEQIEFLLEQVTMYKFDHLTGLPMRRDFEHKLREKVNVCSFYLVYHDVNNLHNVNRLQSEKAGDALIRQVANDIRYSNNTVRAYRTGGDEFFSFCSTEPESIENATTVYIHSKDYLNAEDMITECSRLLTIAKSKNKRRNSDRV